jgi:hypothetical protein
MSQTSERVLTLFNINRISALSDQFAVYWLQSGKVPDKKGLGVMVTAIEAELPTWIGPEMIGKIIPAMRTHSKTLPALSGIIAEAREQAEEQRKKALPSPETATASTYEPAMDKWEEAATLRLCALAGFAFPEPSEFARVAAASAPTREEGAALCRIIAKQPDPNRRAELARRWGGRGPYFIPAETIRSHFPRRNDTVDLDFDL